MVLFTTGPVKITAGVHPTIIGQISSATGGHMTREELERHLEMKQSAKPTFMSLEKTPNSLPDDIFSKWKCFYKLIDFKVNCHIIEEGKGH